MNVIFVNIKLNIVCRFSILNTFYTYAMYINILSDLLQIQGVKLLI